MKISIIIPIYFCELSLYKIIDKCLSSLSKYYPQIEKVLVDDGSPLDCASWPITVRNKTNLGYSGAVNEGIKKATGKILIIANDDLEFKQGDLDRFLSLNPHQLGIYSPKTTDEGEGDRFGSLWGMSRHTYNKIGELRSFGKGYFEDIDYYQRAKLLNIPIIKWHDVIVEHKGKATFNLLSDDHYEIAKKKYKELYGRID